MVECAVCFSYGVEGHGDDAIPGKMRSELAVSLFDPGDEVREPGVDVLVFVLDDGLADGAFFLIGGARPVEVSDEVGAVAAGGDGNGIIWMNGSKYGCSAAVAEWTMDGDEVKR